MNLRQAKYIKTIAEEQSISAAAQKLMISQPSLSQMLAQIEKELGVDLFERGRNAFRPTYAGERYLHAATMMLNAEDILQNELIAIRQEQSGKLRLGISIQRALYILPNVLPAFMQDYPCVQVELTESNSARLEELVREGDVDIALATTEASAKDLTYQLIQAETIGILTGTESKLAKTLPPGTPIHITELIGGDFVELKPGHNVRTIQDKIFHEFNMQPHIVFEADVMEIARRVAIGCNKYMLCTAGLGTSDGVFYPLADHNNSRHYYACSRTGQILPRYVKDFIDRVRNCLAEVH